LQVQTFGSRATTDASRQKTPTSASEAAKIGGFILVIADESD
jgi:hypothetical protein